MKHAVDEIESLGLTKQRKSVLTVIRASDKHLTANEVFEGARQLLPGISFATVYNSLRYLKDEGLIGGIQFGSDAHRYDRKVTQHDHAVCDSCGKIVDMEIALPKKVIEKAAGLSKFNPGIIELTLRGLCPKCSKVRSLDK